MNSNKNITKNILREKFCYNCWFHYHNRCINDGGKEVDDYSSCDKWETELELHRDTLDLTIEEKQFEDYYYDKGITIDLSHMKLENIKYINVYTLHSYSQTIPVNFSEYVNGILLSSRGIAEIYYSNRKIK